MTDERLCSNVLGGLVCGRPESHEIHHPRNATRLGHPFEEAPSTDAGEARWERMEESPDYVVWRKRWAEGYSESSAVPKAIEAAIRAPLEAEVERLREALRKSANDVLWVHRRLEHYLAPWDSDEEARILRDAHSALATPPSSTEGTKEVEG